jgi:cysteine synthase A
MTSILDAIGKTPLIRLRHCVPANGAEIWIKLEYRNPSGSMKDRMALAMIDGAERDRLIGPETTIVEYTGGSTPLRPSTGLRRQGLSLPDRDCRLFH